MIPSSLIFFHFCSGWTAGLSFSVAWHLRFPFESAIVHYTTAALEFVLIYALFFFAAEAQTARRLQHPALMSDKAGCTSWVGHLEGSNDPEARIQLQLCPNGEAITGKMQWSSLVSGWSVRSIEGSWNTSHTELRLRDIELLEDRPEPGWTFCTVDAYRLSISGETMTGTYVSESCNDRATLHLQRAPDKTIAAQESAPVDSEERKPFLHGCIGATVSRSASMLWIFSLFLCAIRRSPDI